MMPEIFGCVGGQSGQMKIPLLQIYNMSGKKYIGSYRATEMGVYDSYSSPWQISWIVG